MNETPAAASSDRIEESRVADRLTRWLIIVIGIPIVLAACGLLVAVTVRFVAQSAGFSAEPESTEGLALRIGSGVLWLTLSVWLVRLLWPDAMYRHPG